MAEVWRWDGIGWNEGIPQQEEDFIRADDDLFVTIPAEAGLYRVDYSKKSRWRRSLCFRVTAEDCGQNCCIRPLFKLTEGTLWGYINNDGRVVIEPRYDYAEEFQENGLAVVQRGNVSGLIDSSGRERVKPVYNFIGPFFPRGGPWCRMRRATLLLMKKRQRSDFRAL
ncbi:WG repeat-containing protein [Paenibacillus rhizoplanae]